MVKMRNKLIMLMISFSALLITLVIVLLYLNLKLKIDYFSNSLMDINQDIVLKLLSRSKVMGREIIMGSNNEVIKKTKEKLNEFIKKASKDQNISILKLVDLSISLEVSSVEELLLNTADSPAFYWQYDIKIKEVLNNIIKKNSFFDGFLMYTETNDILVKLGDIKEKDINKNIIKKIREGEIYYSNPDKNNNFIIGVPINNETQKYKGALFAKIKLREILDYIFKKIDLGIEKTIFVIDDSNNILKHKNGDYDGKIFKDIKFDKKEFFQQIVSNEAIYTILKYKNKINFYIIIQEYISDSFSYVDSLKEDAEKSINESFNEFDTILKGEVKKTYETNREAMEQKLEDFATDVLSVIIFIILISIGIAVLMGIILANYITHPINLLSIAAKKIGDGDLNYEIEKELLVKKDEIGTLAKEFADMQLKLKLGIEQIKDLERKKALAEKMKANAEKMAVIGQMASGIVHEIKNPLTSISGFAQIIHEIADNDMIKGHSKIIIDETARLNKLTLELLDYAKAKKLEIEKIDIYGLIRNNIERIKPKIEAKNVTIKLNFDKDSLIIEADKDKLTQVFINIISNSIEVLPDKDGLVNIEGISTNEGVVLEFRDNGPGIPDKIKEKLFMPFVTGKKGGTGLGLAMVKRIIDDHAGEIKVKSELGKGTTFTIKLNATFKKDEESSMSA